MRRANNKNLELHKKTRNMKKLKQIILKQFNHSKGMRQLMLLFIILNAVISNAQPVLIGKTTWDNQSNGSAPNRIQVRSNGEIYVAYTGSLQSGSFNDRGTFLQKFDGTNWQSLPNTRIESSRTGWPSLLVTETGKQCIVAHDAAAISLVINTRNSGTGSWTMSSNSVQGMWPRAVNSGGDTIHAICLNSNIGTNKHIKYFRSINAGLTWDINGIMLPGSDSIGGYNWDYGTEYYSIDAKGNTVAIVIGGGTNKTVLYKSVDGGANFTTTLIKSVPQPYINGFSILSDFESPSGRHSVCVGNNAMVHFFAGKTKIYDADATDGSYSFYPNTDSIWYWNDNMSPNSIKGVIGMNSYSQGANYGLQGAIGTLSAAYDHTFQKLNLVFDVKGTNSNGFRDLFVTQSSNNGTTFISPLQLTQDGANGKENITPSLAKSNDNRLHIIWQKMTWQGFGVTTDTASIYYQKVDLTPINVRFRVDMSNQTVNSNGVYISGSFQGWNPGTTPMTLESGNIYKKDTVVYGIVGPINYVFLNGNTWADSEANNSSCFGGIGARTLILFGLDTILPAFEFGGCNPINPARIFIQPKNLITKAPGAGSFIVQTLDSGVTYQWQTNTGSGFNNINNGGQYAGVNNDTLIVSNIQQSNNNQQYRCLTVSGAFRDTSIIAKIIIPNVPNNVPVNGLVGYWPFTGNAADSSGNGNNGTVNGATLTTDRYGNANKAYSYDGSSSYINVPNSSSLQFNGGITISTWLNASSSPSPVSYWFSKGSDGGTPYSWISNLIGSTKIMNIGVYDNSNNYVGVSSNTALQLNTWINFAVTFDGINAKAYVNGVLENTISCSYNTFANAYDLTFGRRYNSGSPYFWDGKIDDFGIWNRALSEPEIKRLYNRAAIYVQPKNILTKVNSSGSFIVQTADSVVTYQWQTNTGSGFTNISNGGQFSGVNNDTLLVSNIIQSNHNQQFRCLTSAGLDRDTSNIAGIIILNVPEYVPVDGLSAYWSFKGNGIDSSGNGNNLSAIGTVNYAVDRYGKANSCTSFDGTGSGLFERINPNLPGGNSTRTVSFWYKTTQSSSNQLVFCLWGGFDLCHSNFAALANTKSVYFWGKCEDKGFDLTTSQDWVHIVLVYENNFMKLYRNGVLINSVTDNYYIFNANLRTAINHFTVGFDPTSDFPDHFNGLIDDMAFWNRALTQGEISKLYNTCNPEFSTFTVSACSSYIWSAKGNKLYIESNNTDTLLLKTIGGCDSIVTLNLTINQLPNTSAIVGLTNVPRLDTTSYSVTGLPGSTFNWNAQGANIETGTGSNKIRVKWQTTGTQQITVTETSNQGCVGVQKTLSVNVGPATGIIESTSIGNIEIYPNPTTGNVNMKVDVKLIGSNYAVIDVLGKTVLTGTIKTNEEILNLENVSAGIYFISVGDNLKQTFKIVKE